MEAGDFLQVSLCKGRFRGIFDLAQHEFDETLRDQRRGLHSGDNLSKNA